MQGGGTINILTRIWLIPLGCFFISHLARILSLGFSPSENKFHAVGHLLWDRDAWRKKVIEIREELLREVLP